MKFKKVLVMSLLMGSTCWVHAQKITLNCQNQQLEKIFSSITKQTGLSLTYSPELIDLKHSVSIQVSSLELKDVLDKLFAGTDIGYQIDRKSLYLFNKGKQKPENSSTKQVRKIQGIITDTNGEAIIGANVLVKGSSNGTITDVNGHFILPDVHEKEIIQITYIGYETAEVVIDKRNEFKIALKENSKVLDEVVVVGYGVSSRLALTTAISKVDGEKLEGTTVNSLGDALKGKVAGMHIASVDNQPGSNPKFLIRGGSSINQSNDPIIIVDGVQRDIAGLNPNDIESVEVLKDAASAGIYGARASNGVVLVTTKKGNPGRGPQIVFETQVGNQSPATKFDLMNAADYIRTVRLALSEGLHPEVLYAAESAGTGNGENSIWTTRYLQEGETIPAGWQAIDDPVNPGKTIIFQDTDQQKGWFGNALWQNYYIGVNGGNEQMKYTASAGYTDDQGSGAGTGYKRFTTHANTAFKVTRNFTVSSTFDFGQTDITDFPGNKRNTVIRGLSIPNTHRDVLSDGTPAQASNGTTMTSLWYKTYYVRGNVQKRTSVNLNMEWKIIDDLRAVAQFTEHNRHTRTNTFLKANAVSSQRQMTETFSETNRIDFQTYLNYNHGFKSGHNLDVVAGYDYMYDRLNSLSAATIGASSDKVPTLDSGTESVKGYPQSTRTNECLISYFGRVNYDYQKRYLLSLTMRADASSKFSKDNWWGYFPAVSAGWLVSQESFWNVKPVNMFKLRASYGLTGNNGIGLYDTYGSYETDQLYNGNSTTTMGLMPNAGLTWEKTSQLDLGIDAGLFNNRLKMSLDYYNKVTRDLLFDVTLPNTTGYSTATDNVGKVRFYGFDLQLSSINIQNKNFLWTTDFSISYNMNRVLKLPDNNVDRNRIGGHVLGDGTQFGGIAEGERLGRIYGYKVAYILETEAQADAAMYDESSRGFRRSDRKQVPGRKDVGDYEWVNRPGSSTNSNGEDIINAEDQFLLGYVLPHTTGGIQNTLRYKNFTFSIYLDYALGHTINNSLQMRYFMATMGNCNYNLVNDVKDCWKQPGDNTKYARFTANDPDWGNRNFGRTSDVFCQKGDYLCLRDVSLSYSFPKKWIRSVGLQDASLTLSGNTLFYWTAVTGVSPEAVTSSSSGLYGVKTNYDTDYNPYPPTRKFIIGVKLVF